MLEQISIRPLREDDLEATDRVMRVAFGTFLGVPDPMLVFGDADYVRSRFAAQPGWAAPASHAPSPLRGRSPEVDDRRRARLMRYGHALRPLPGLTRR